MKLLSRLCFLYCFLAVNYLLALQTQNNLQGRRTYRLHNTTNKFKISLQQDIFVRSLCMKEHLIVPCQKRKQTRSLKPSEKLYVWLRPEMMKSLVALTVCPSEKKKKFTFFSKLTVPVFRKSFNQNKVDNLQKPISG